MSFTTRPDIRGSFGTVASTHWIASAVGMGILEKGGNAFDAAVATALTLQVVEPHLNGPGGDLPAIVHLASGETRVLCAQGVAPKGATLDHYRQHFGDGLIPGSGLLATVVPGAFDGWMLMLRDHGSMELAEVLAPTISYARDGHPVLPRVSNTIAGIADFFRQEWPTSAATWLRGGEAPAPWSMFKNPDLAATWQRIVDEAEGETREARIDVARRIWSQGFVADAICDYLKDACVMDVSGRAHSAVLSRQDLAEWQAHWEQPLTVDYHGWTVYKSDSWAQAPVLLQALQILKNFDLSAMDPLGADFTHTVIEAMKLAFVDAHRYVTDPEHMTVASEALLDSGYLRERAALIDMDRAQDFGHGQPPGSGTVYLSSADADGNMVSLIQSNYMGFGSGIVVPDTGIALQNRGAGFSLEEGHANRVAPGKRPFHTIIPGFLTRAGRPELSFGVMGGPMQPQGHLQVVLRMKLWGQNAQAASDAPRWQVQEGLKVVLEDSVSKEVLTGLAARGHELGRADQGAFGGAQLVQLLDNGYYLAASDHRKDGQAVGW